MVYRMNTIKVKWLSDIPVNYTGIAEFEDGDKHWFKNGNLHREDGPAVLWNDGAIEWWLDGICVWYSSRKKFDFTNIIIISKEQHPEYPTVQIWKYVNKHGIQEQIVIPGMEAKIITPFRRQPKQN